jgi:SARP family transcriptional regulator, regulator of embCAB operon
MRIHVLGPLNAEVNGTSIVPSAGKPRQILSLLALQPRRIVPVPTLMEELWGMEPPPSALTTLQTYILQLRRRLGTAIGPGCMPVAKDILATRHGGYLLDIDSDCVDVHEYETLVRHGQAAFEAGDDKMSAEHFHEALDLWTGPPLVDVSAGPVLEIEVIRLQESRLVTVERCIDADLRLGRHSELIADLTDLTARYPHHEGLHSQVMVALYRAGRQASALDVYRRLRIRLIEELGVEPAPQLQRMHQAMLAVDPMLDVIAAPRHSSTYDLFIA